MRVASVRGAGVERVVLSPRSRRAGGRPSASMNSSTSGESVAAMRRPVLSCARSEALTNRTLGGERVGARRGDAQFVALGRMQSDALTSDACAPPWISTKTCWPRHANLLGWSRVRSASQSHGWPVKGCASAGSLRRGASRISDRGRTLGRSPALRLRKRWPNHDVAP